AKPVNNTDEHHSGNPAAGGQTDADRGSICGYCMAINVMPVCFRVPSAASICGDFIAINVIPGSICFDCMAMSCCFLCAICQMQRELEAMGL
ncbi:hypothetical protein MAR_016773, partial [Mya arenaria]